MSSRSLPFHIHICETPEYKVPATETLCVRSPHCEQLSVANKAEAAQQPKITLHACHFRVIWLDRLSRTTFKSFFLLSM